MPGSRFWFGLGFGFGIRPKANLSMLHPPRPLASKHIAPAATTPAVADKSEGLACCRLGSRGEMPLSSPSSASLLVQTTSARENGDRKEQILTLLHKMASQPAGAFEKGRHPISAVEKDGRRKMGRPAQVPRRVGSLVHQNQLSRGAGRKARGQNLMNTCQKSRQMLNSHGKK